MFGKGGGKGSEGSARSESRIGESKEELLEVEKARELTKSQIRC